MEEPVKVEEEPIKINIAVESVKADQNIKVEQTEKVGDDNDDDDNCEDLEYSMDDVHLICEKLYRD